MAEKKAITVDMQSVGRRIDIQPGETILNEAEEIVLKIKEEFHPREILISMVSPVLGVHTGPRAVAICGYAE
jgi:fatty acid-binding protein DegV